MKTQDRIKHILPIGAFLVVLSALRVYDFIVFHYVVELFSIVIGAVMFVIVWNNRARIESAGLLLIGISYLFVGLVDLFHTLAYAGTGLFDAFAPDLPTQLWILARHLEAFSLLLGSMLLHRRARPYLTLLLYIGGTTLLTAIVFPLRLFPTAYAVGVGLTPFKIVSEYVVIAVVALAGYQFYRRRSLFTDTTRYWIFVSIVATITGEFMFTAYIGVYDVANVVGHLLKVVSFYGMYRAFVVIGIAEPNRILYRNLHEREQELSEAVAHRDLLLREVHHRVKNNLSLVMALIGLEYDNAPPAHRDALSDLSNRIATIEMVHDRLSRTESTQMVDIVEYVNDIASRLVTTLSPIPVTFVPSVGSISIAARTAISIALVVSEIVTNIVKHAFPQRPNGLVRLGIVEKSDELTINLENDGESFTEVSTRVSQSLGVGIINSLLDTIGGTISRSSDGELNATTISIPLPN